MKRIAALTCCALMLFCLGTGSVLANKSAVSMEAPASAEQGSEVTLRLTVTHNANSFFHYTNRLKVMVNGAPLTEWDFTSGNKPEGAVFTRDVKIRITGNTEIVAEANCNIHGSSGPAKAKILVSETATPAAK